MKARDAEVRAHERAHQSAASGIKASAATYDTEKGPDGKDYAVAGEVQLSFTPTSDAEQNIRMAEAMRRAALAPAKPSSQDRKVAQHATQLINQYRQEMQQERVEENNKKMEENNSDSFDINSLFDSNNDFEMPEIGGEKLENVDIGLNNTAKNSSNADKSNVIDMQEYAKKSVEKSEQAGIEVSKKSSNASAEVLKKSENSKKFEIENVKPSVNSSKVAGLSKETVAFQEKQIAKDEESSQPDVTLV